MSSENWVSKQTIGIIGYGKFGKLLSKEIFSSNKINTFDISSSESTTSLAQLVKESTIVIPSVPIREFEQTIKEISLAQDPSYQVVMDVCSVKEYPSKVMLLFLSKDVNIIATHPMFGPSSFAERGSFEGFKLVMNNVRCSSEIYTQVRKYFESLGLVVIEMTPENHDRQTARTQFFAQTMRYISQELGLSSTQIDTFTAAQIFSILNLMGNDQKILEDIIKYNRFAKGVLDDMIEALSKLKKNE